MTRIFGVFEAVLVKPDVELLAAQSQFPGRL
jgi:hypothetical protein